jgi:class 3 adenylate cyclase
MPADEIPETQFATLGDDRIAYQSAPGEVVVSATVPMLVTGAGFEFDDRGERELKGVPGTWHLYAVRT